MSILAKMRHRSGMLLSCAFVATACLIPFAQAWSASQFFGLGGIAGKPVSKSPTAFSTDGLKIVANACTFSSFDSECSPFLWSPEGPSVPLDLLAGDSDATAWGMSSDGQIVVGESRDSPTSSWGSTAVRWSNGGPPVPLATHGESVVTTARYITPDGSVVAGTWYESGKPRALGWTESGGVEQLLDPSQPTLERSTVTGLSVGGQIAAYLYRDSSGSSPSLAVRWTPDGGLESLGPLPAGYASSDTVDTAELGDAIIGNLWTGHRFGSSSVAYRWTSISGMEVLPVPSEHLESRARIISRDGSVVLGQFKNAASSALEWEAFRWTPSGGIQSLGPAAGFDSTGVRGLTEQGEVFWGSMDRTSLELVYDAQNTYDVYLSRIERRSYLWSAQSGRVDFPHMDLSPTCDHDLWSVIEDVTVDRSIVLGRGRCHEADQFWEEFEPFDQAWVVRSTTGQPIERWFAWDEAHGFRSLESFVQDQYGVDLTGWQLDSANISDDGQMLWGVGTHDFSEEAWVLYVPEPSSSLMLASGASLLALLSMRRQRRTR